MKTFIFPKLHRRVQIDLTDAFADIPKVWQELFVWTSREDYLDWVTQWKACLHQTIAAIRQARARRSDRSLSIWDRNIANCQRQQLRIECCNLLLIRAIGKQQAARQSARLRHAA